MNKKEIILATKERRKYKKCATYELKIIKSKLSSKSLKHLNKLFLEAKWFHNHILSSGEDIKNFNTKIKEVTVLNKNKEKEIRKIDVLSAQMRQEIKDKIFRSILSLSALKKTGKKIGALKCKSKVFSISLKQLNHAFSINFINSSIRIQKLKQNLKVKGLHQIKENYEIANAQLVRKCNDFYLLVTTYADKEEKIMPETSVGIDFGCETQLTLSNGIKIKYEIPVSKRLRRLDRKIMKKNRKKSYNKYKDQRKREKEYQHIKNKKKDIKNKIVSTLVNNFKYISIQNENIKGWQANHGKKIQNTSLGGIIDALKRKAHTLIEINRFFPSSQLCLKCENKQKMSQEKRTYVCPVCGYEEDRDINASRNILREGLKDTKVPTEHRELKPQESRTSALSIMNKLKSIHNVRVSSLVEWGSLKSKGQFTSTL